jgi:ABC-type sugar transport system permease subunit
MNPVTTSNQGIKTPGPTGSATRLKLARQWHLYLGTLFAPSIIFFAFTGSLQLFSLHESHKGDSYQAPAWIQKLASIHKDQVLEKNHKAPPPPAAEQKGLPPSDAARRPAQPEGSGPKDEDGSKKFTLALKWFFLAMAVGLVSSTLLGIYMAFKFNRSRALVWGMLMLGTAIPLALIAMMALS